MTMKDTFELIVGNDGSIEGIYQDDLAKTLDAEQVQICRASHVEFEEIDGRKGWTVRSAKDPELALRVTDWCRWAPCREGTIVTFATREEALAEEVKHFWGIIEHNATRCPICKAKLGEPCDAGLHG